MTVGQKSMGYHTCTICVLCSLALLLTACGTLSLASTAPGGHLLTVTRTITIPDNHFPAFSKYSDDKVSVIRLDKTILALPPMQGVYSCPMDDGLHYQLTFSFPFAPQQQWTLAGSGCKQITSVQSRQSFLTNDAFWSMLAQTLGVPEAELFPQPATS